MKKVAKKKAPTIKNSTLYKRMCSLSWEMRDLRDDIADVRKISSMAQFEGAAQIAGRLRDTNRQLADLSRGVARLLSLMGQE